MARRFTLFIDDTDIRLLVVNGRRVEKWADLPLESGIVTSGVVQDEEKLASLLQENLRLLRIREKRVILGLSGLNSIHRIISVPVLPDSMLPEAVRREAQRIMPVSLNDVYLAYQPIPVASGERRIFLSAFPRNATDSLIRTMRKAGLQPYLMDLAPLALSHAVDLPRAIVVNVWGVQMDIIVMVERVPQVIRSIQIPGETESLTEKLATIAEEIERTAAFYNTSQPAKQLDAAVPILVCGDLAKSQENWPLLSGRLGHPISMLPSPLEFREGFEQYQFMVNIGLSLKNLPSRKNNLDFSLIDFNALPVAYRVKQVSIFNIVAPVVTVIIISLIVLMAYMARGVSAHTGALSSQLAAIQEYSKTQQRDIVTLTEKIKGLEEAIAPLDTLSKALDNKLVSLRENRIRFDDNASEVVRLLPVELLKLTTVSYTKDVIMVSGKSKSDTINDINGIYAYGRALRATARFSVIITSIELKEQATEGEEETESNYDFTLTLTVRQPKP